MTNRVVPIVLCAAAALVGCGQDKQQLANVNQIRGVVTQFAQSNNARACDLLSVDAMTNVYGGYSKPYAASKAVCVKKSSQFKGEPVKITRVQVISDATAKVTALSQKGDVTYTVTVRKFGANWKIDEINQAKTQ
jgi:hypothetical protein